MKAVTPSYRQVLFSRLLRTSKVLVSKKFVSLVMSAPRFEIWHILVDFHHRFNFYIGIRSLCRVALCSNLMSYQSKKLDVHMCVCLLNETLKFFIDFSKATRKQFLDVLWGLYYICLSNYGQLSCFFVKKRHGF